MAPFGSMGFAADGGVEGGCLQMEGEEHFSCKTEQEPCPRWEILLIVFGVCCSFLALFVSSFSCFQMELSSLQTGIQNFSLSERGITNQVDFRVLFLDNLAF